MMDLQEVLPLLAGRNAADGAGVNAENGTEVSLLEVTGCVEPTDLSNITFGQLGAPVPAAARQHMTVLCGPAVSLPAPWNRKTS